MSATAIPVATDAPGDSRAFWVACTYGDEGTIRDSEGKVLLSFNPSGRETSFSDSESQEVFVIRRKGMAPFSRWLLFGAEALVCAIQRRGLWRSKYTLDFSNGGRWTVRFPLFTAWYTCTSDQGEQFRLRNVQYTAWWVEHLPEQLDLSFLAGLAVLQRERWSA